MRVLQVHNRYRQRGGEDAVVDAEAFLLRQAGHEVIQHQVENPAGALGATRRLSVAAWNPIAARSVAQAAAAFEPDVVHVHNTWFSLTAAAIRALRDLPVAMTLHNYRFACANAQLLRDGAPCELCIEGSAFNAVRYRCYRGSLGSSAVAALAIGTNRRLGTWARHVDRFFVLSEFAKEAMTRAGLPSEKLVVKPNFVADPGPRANDPSQSAMALFVGRLSPEKGLDTLLEAWRRSGPPGLELLVVGDGPQRGELEATAPERVRFLGRVEPDEVRALMLAARALLFPSIWYEGQPVTMVEAMASGLPIMASAHGVMPEMLVGLDRWLVPPGDPEAWASSLEMLTAGDIDDTGRELRNRYEQRHTPEIGLDTLLVHFAAVREHG